MINELIPITKNNGEQVVSGRALHDFLEIATLYKDWFPRMCEYGFIEGSDYTTLIFEHPQNKQPFTDHALTLSMAKELSMIQRTDKGKRARQYFIECERQLKEKQPSYMIDEPIARAERWIEEYKEKQELMQKIESDKPKVVFADTVCKSCDNILIRDMAKLLCDQKINIGEKRLYKLLRDKGILMSKNIPYQSYIDRGYFEVKETTYNTPYGIRIGRTTVVTPQGQVWLVSKVGEWLLNIYGGKK